VTAAALSPAPFRPLPVIVKPVHDELLSSWLARLARFYCVDPQALLGHMGIAPPPVLRTLDFAPTATVKERLAWCLRTTASKIQRHCHSTLAVWPFRIVSMHRPGLPCPMCARPSTAAGKAGVRSRSWFECWRLVCGVCKEPYHMMMKAGGRAAPRLRLRSPVDHVLWRDAERGSVLVDNFTRGLPGGILPPDMAFKILTLPGAAALIVPETRRAHRRHTLGGINNADPFARISALASLARFSDDPRAWCDRISDAGGPTGRRAITDLVNSLPDVIADQFRNRGSRVSASSYEVRHGGQTVKAHQLRKKTMLNLRQIEDSCLALSIYAAQHRGESRG